LEWEIKTRKHNSKENPPATGTSNKSTSTSRRLQFPSQCNISIRDLEVGASKEAESEDKSEEDQEEDDVRAEGENHVQKAHDSHSDKKEGERGVEGHGSDAESRVRWVR
jgi:hypothetical protein